MTTFILTKCEVKRLTLCQQDGMVSQPDSLTALQPFGKWCQLDWLLHHQPTRCEAQCTAPLSGQIGPAHAQDSIPAVTAPPDCKHTIFTGESLSDRLDCLSDVCCLFPLLLHTHVVDHTVQHWFLPSCLQSAAVSTCVSGPAMFPNQMLWQGWAATKILLMRLTE